MRGKMTLREFFAIALPEIVPDLSEEERIETATRFLEGRAGRPDIDDLADPHALDGFNVQRFYDIPEVMAMRRIYEKCLDLHAIPLEEGDMIWQKVSDLQDDLSNRRHSRRRNPFLLMSAKSKKAVWRNIGRPCDVVQVLQMFHESYESEAQRDEDANNREELFPILRDRFQYEFKFKVEGRTLTYFKNHNVFLRDMMVIEFWFGLRSNWTSVSMERERLIRNIRDRDNRILEELDHSWESMFVHGRYNHDKFLAERGFNPYLEFGGERENSTFDNEDMVYEAIMMACDTMEGGKHTSYTPFGMDTKLPGKVSFSIGEIMESCVSKAIERHRIIWPVACRNDMLGTRRRFGRFESYAGWVRDVGHEFRDAARFFCIYNANGLPIPESEGYEHFPQEVAWARPYYLSSVPYNPRNSPECNVTAEQYAGLLRTDPAVLRKSLNLTGLKALERLEKQKADFEELDREEKYLIPDEWDREREHGRAMALANRLLEMASWFDEEQMRGFVERLHGHIGELEGEFVPGAPVDGADMPQGFDVTECPICGTQFECCQDDYFRRAECPTCNEKMLVLPGMSLWNRLVEAGIEERENPAPAPVKPEPPPLPKYEPPKGLLTDAIRSMLVPIEKSDRFK